MAVALAAAEPSGERALCLSAASDLGVGLPEFREAGDAGLLEETSSTFTVRHPLLRSVALQRTEHSRDCGVCIKRWRPISTKRETERRAWHLAAAADAPDEFVAALVESVAHAALSRSDVSAAVAGFEQAAMLSPRSPTEGGGSSMRGRRPANRAGRRVAAPGACPHR